MQSGFRSIRYAAVGTALPEIHTSPVVWPTSPGAKANEVQTVTLSNATGGTFTLSFGGQETGNIPYDALASEVEEALEALSTIGEGNVDVSGSSGGPFAVTFIRDLGNQDVALMEADESNLTGTDPEVSVVETTPGSAGGGIWTPCPNIDPEKDVEILWDGVMRKLYSPSSKRPIKGHVIRASAAGLKMTSTESAMAALEFMFPAFEKTGHILNLSAFSVETPYKAIALEMPEGVLVCKKMAPAYDMSMVLQHNDITQPEFTLDAYEDDNGDVSFFHEFY